MKQRRAFTLVMALVVLALLSGMGAALTAPTLREARVVNRHQARLDAEYLALAGVEYARSIIDLQPDQQEGTYKLGNGEVSVRIEPLEGRHYHVTSTGTVKAGRGAAAVTWTLERRITAK